MTEERGCDWCGATDAETSWHMHLDFRFCSVACLEAFRRCLLDAAKALRRH